MGKTLKIIMLCVLVAALLPRCARQSSTLTGGEKDTIPPVFLYAEPAMNATGFDAKRIDIYFDEFVKLQNVNSSFIVSPPMKEKPEVVLYGKYVRVKLGEAPREGYTYTLDFGETIVDNNENNKMGFFEYVFSTSDHIDSLSIRGRVVNAFDGAPAKTESSDIKVLMYNVLSDSIPYKEPPAYVARADANGFFEFNHLRPDTFLVFAIQDIGDDLMFNVPEENVAFLDTFVVVDTTFIQPLVADDPFRNDSLKEKYPDMVPRLLDLYLFQEEKTRQYRTSYSRPSPNVLMFTYNLPVQDTLALAFADTLTEQTPPLPFMSAARDTAWYWLTDTALINMTSLRFSLTGPVTDDSLKTIVSRTDTLRMVSEELANAQAQSAKRRKKSDDGQAEKKPYELLSVTSGTGNGKLALNGTYRLSFSQPLARTDESRISLAEQVNDSVWSPVEYRLLPDSTDLLRAVMDWKFKEGATYRLTADTMAFTSIYGAHNDSLGFNIEVQELDYYSNIQVTLRNVKGPMLIQVLQPDSEKVIKQLPVDRNGILNIAYLEPGKYVLKAVHDTNGNGKWDTGNYLRKIQPERVQYYPEELTTQSSFTTEADWTLK